MYKFIILLSILGCALGAAISRLDSRVVGGNATSINSAPWQVGIFARGSYLCGGSIYSANIIITVANLLIFAYPHEMQVRAGSSDWKTGGSLIDVAAYKLHEDYSQFSMANNIAVLRLKTALRFSETIQPIALAKQSPISGALASFTGWGSTQQGAAQQPNLLQSIDVNIISLSDCASDSYSYGDSVRSSMICATAEGKGACFKDSGGPLVSAGVLVGVYSWSLDCASMEYPNIYTDVAESRTWIINAARAV